MMRLKLPKLLRPIPWDQYDRWPEWLKKAVKLRVRVLWWASITLIVALLTLAILSGAVSSVKDWVLYAKDVRVLMAWACPKADKRMSKSQVRQTILAHLRYSDWPEHTLAIVMAESAFFPGATNERCKDAWGGGQIRWTQWEKALKKAGIITNRRDLFDIEVTARAMSFILHCYLALLPDDLETPGISITYAMTFYNGDAEGKTVIKGVADRKEKLSDKELEGIMAKLPYPVTVFVYTAEILAIRQGGRNGYH